MRSSRFLSRFARAAGLRTAVAALLVLPFVTCGGGGGGSSTPTQPTGPTQAQVTVSYTNVGWFADAVPGFNYAIQFTITIRETAGVGIKGNFLRAELYGGPSGTGTHLGTREAGGDILGHMNGGTSETETIAIGFNAGDTASIVMTLNVTDDRGNVLTNTQTFNCCG